MKREFVDGPACMTRSELAASWTVDTMGRRNGGRPDMCRMAGGAGTSR